MYQVLRVMPWIAGLTAVCAVVAGLTQGAAGVRSALLAGVIVTVFFVSSPVALGPITKVAPGLSLIAAMMFFATKVIALLVLFIVLSDAQGDDAFFAKASLGISVIVLALLWTWIQIVVAKRQRLAIYDLSENQGATPDNLIPQERSDAD
jgi:ATP synthase protein I